MRGFGLLLGMVAVVWTFSNGVKTDIGKVDKHVSEVERDLAVVGTKVDTAIGELNRVRDRIDARVAAKPVLLSPCCVDVSPDSNPPR